MDLRNHKLFRLRHQTNLLRAPSMSTPSLGPFEAVLGGEMVSRRRILSRSRDDLTQAFAPQPEDEEDVWYQKDKLYKEHIQEVLDKWTQIDDEIWAKVIVFERNRRVAKAYARAPVLTINGSDDGFDGMRIGLCGFDNPHRDQKTDELKKHIGQGVKIKMDDAGNILIRRYSKSSVVVKSTAGPGEESAIGQDVTKLPGMALEHEKIFKLFDMKKFQSNVNRELRRSYPDRRRLETQCLSAVAFVRAEPELLDCPVWVLVVNVVAMDMLKSKLPPVQRPMDIKNRPRIPIPDEDPYSIASSNANGSGSSGSSGGYGPPGLNGLNGHGVVAATREQLLMQMGQRRGERPPKLPPRENPYPADIPKPDYDDIESGERAPAPVAQFPRGRSDKGKDNKKYDDPYYCGLRARVPNFVKAPAGGAGGKHALPAMAERLSLADAPAPSKRYSLHHPAPLPLQPLQPLQPYHPVPQAALWHARSYESGIDGEGFDPYAVYGRLPARAYPLAPPHRPHMFIGDWD
ncbi:uncharacterized protein LOC121730509 isoform X2 [Aricia agestis]|uniref:uncharacterized protein LOC121730509 isoform X2 n=1 Tax=Aricia agestis TaxID=91739 RepID=UPI001C207EC6|nr:uncharacterized protein LOC121730509 isoform X2 [Aricia agestis]